MNHEHAANGLKSKADIGNPKVAFREFERLFAETAEAENATFEKELLGDACKQMRESVRLTQNEMSREGSLSVAQIKVLEKSCSCADAVQYRAALLRATTAKGRGNLPHSHHES